MTGEVSEQGINEIIQQMIQMREEENQIQNPQLNNLNESFSSASEAVDEEEVYNSPEHSEISNSYKKSSRNSSEIDKK